jgi:hypothetical protein
MDTNTLSSKVAATLAATVPQAKNRHLSTDPKRMAVVKVWDSMTADFRAPGLAGRFYFYPITRSADYSSPRVR